MKTRTFKISSTGKLHTINCHTAGVKYEIVTRTATELTNTDWWNGLCWNCRPLQANPTKETFEWDEE